MILFAQRNFARRCRKLIENQVHLLPHSTWTLKYCRQYFTSMLMWLCFSIVSKTISFLFWDSYAQANVLFFHYRNFPKDLWTIHWETWNLECCVEILIQFQSSHCIERQALNQASNSQYISILHYKVFWCSILFYGSEQYTHNQQVVLVNIGEPVFYKKKSGYLKGQVYVYKETGQMLKGRQDSLLNIFLL